MARFTEAERVEVWDRWQAGDAYRLIGRDLGRSAGSIRAFVESWGGVRPRVRRRSSGHLSMSAEELERFFDDDEVSFVDCDEVGGATWDYGPIDENSPRDREPTDALRDALDYNNEGNDVQEGDLYWLPLTGSIALTRGEGSFVFVLSDESDRWIAYVTVGGDPNEGIWREHNMVACDPRFL